MALDASDVDVSAAPDPPAGSAVPAGAVTLADLLDPVTTPAGRGTTVGGEGR
jgi:hypothetical protein